MGTTDIERNKQVAIAFWNRIFVGRDPAIEAAKLAKAGGEEAVAEPVALLTE